MLITILLLLAEFILKNINNDETKETYFYFNYCLLGKMRHFLINGSLKDPFEIQYDEQLTSTLFARGCEKIFRMIDYQQDITIDYESLMSIYNNMGDGGQLIAKIRKYAENKQYVIQKSIEKQVNDACIGLFAVYIKYYRRINLAKYE
ncbi:unnamed protein product [Rotaria sp. Silwood2]|nr:unnamed protein product [Rotaria sp. Silwood2]